MNNVSTLANEDCSRAKIVLFSIIVAGILIWPGFIISPPQYCLSFLTLNIALCCML